MKTYRILLLPLLWLALPLQAADCPWKVMEIGPQLDTATAIARRAWAHAEVKDREIARLRRALLRDCQAPSGVAGLEAFSPRIADFDPVRQQALAAQLLACTEAKRDEGQARLARARAAGQRALERRLIDVLGVIERDAQRAFAHEISVHQLVSKLERLATERERLLATCRQLDF
ncbi:hypothetical protein [Marichromatium bheemlicum]|uniref:Uncharacterized protein n=1 Tax=Marichromatium bheemlicum TaxID=365339 RepID=A0ABX1I497_9GAMM|nr:hypothetical protein [Marichromatium bheemlicum]NKN31684.1 hypothetical protein [Marichromatium bheemlicum]